MKFLFRNALFVCLIFVTYSILRKYILSSIIHIRTFYNDSLSKTVAITTNVYLTEHFRQKSLNGTNISQHKPQTDQLVDRIEMIGLKCGQLCNTSRPGAPGLYYQHISSSVDCMALYRNDYIGKAHKFTFNPRKMSDVLRSHFTMNGRVNLVKRYYDRELLAAKDYSNIWTEQMIEQYIRLARNRILQSYYGISETNALREGLAHANGIKHGRVLVLGSEIPWVEACVLEAGASIVETLFHSKIISKHPKVKTMTPYEFTNKYLDGTIGMFDAVVIYNSIEQSGLGIYDDDLNPWGDIISIARAWCVTKDGGSLTIGVIYNYDNDMISFNAGRYYGKIRYPYLTTNWRQIYRGHGARRIHVLEKSEKEYPPKLYHYLKKPEPYIKQKLTNDKHYSLAKQDKTVYDIFPRKNGFFVELGAYDGKLVSNTLWLEQKHNWTGLLVEGNPKLCDLIDQKKRRIWRLCASIYSESTSTFIKTGGFGGFVKTMNSHRMKQFNNNQTRTVPCFELMDVLTDIGHTRINYLSLDVEGAELNTLNTLKSALKARILVVDIWTVEYRVWNGTRTVLDKSRQKLNAIRLFFKDITGYFEYSLLPDIDKDSVNGVALDIVLVNVDTWCSAYKTFPNGTVCM